MSLLSTTDFLHKIHAGDRATAVAHLDAGGEVNVADDRGFTPLLVAIVGGHPELAAELIDRGADVRAKLNSGHTTLLELIKRVRQLGSRPVDFSVTIERDGEMVTLIDPAEIRAVIGSHPDDEHHAWLSLARKLIEHGVDVHAAKHASGQRALRDAAEASGDLVALLLECSKPEVNVADNEGFTPLHLAARSGDPRTIELLLAAGATVDAVEHYGFTPLHEALLNRNVEAARRLLAAGADPNTQIVRSYDSYEAGDDAYAIAKKCKMLEVFESAST